ncbi:MAG TPA: dTMP kinase [Nitriliruptorales bacterium]
MSGDAAGGVASGQRPAAYRTLFANRDYRDLFWAMLTSSLGDWMGLFAILALTENILGPTRAAAFALSGVMIARVVPTLALGPVAGVFVDRWDRKRTMIATDIGRGAVMVLVAFAGDVFQLVVATFLIEVMSTLFVPAKDATLPNLVSRERLVQANQLSLMVTYGTLPVGAAAFALFTGTATTFLSGVPFLSARPIALPILINAATFFVSAAFIARIAVPRNGRHRREPAPAHAAAQQGAWSELVAGFRFIAQQPLVRALVGGVMAAFLSAGVVLAVGKLFTTVLNAGDTGFGVLGAVVGVGLFVGLAIAGPLSARIDKARLFAPGIGIGGGGLVVTALMPRLDLATIPAFAMGAGAGVSFIVGYTMLQEQSVDELRGRTFAAFNTGVRAALFVALVVGPALVGVIGLEQRTGGTYPYTIGGARLTLIIAGTVAIAGAVVTGRAIHRALTSRIGLADVHEPRVRRATGFLVAFEGGEGAGKSTQISRLRRAVEGAGYDVLVTREPGGTPLGEQLRHLLLEHGMPDIGDRTEALLYAAARAQHTEEVLRPHLAYGTVVLCDRYVDSSIVYQGGVRGLGEAQIEELNRWATDELVPDLVVLLDVDAEEGLRRARGQDAAGRAGDRLESEGLAFHRSVNELFRKRAAASPDRYLVVDASRDPDEIGREVGATVLERLRRAEPGRPAPPDASQHAGTVRLPRSDVEQPGVQEPSRD